MSGYPVKLMSLLAGEAQTLGAILTSSADAEYETVAVSQTTQVLGAVGAVGDMLGKLICVVSLASGAAQGRVQLKDGADAAFDVLGGAAVTTPVGTYVLDIGLLSRTGAWQVTTGPNVTVIATGIFS